MLIRKKAGSGVSKDRPIQVNALIYYCSHYFGSKQNRTTKRSRASISGNFTERTGVLSMRDCIGKCCDDTSCDLAFMFGDHCYSVSCQSEKLCQAVLAKPSHLEPKISYVSRVVFEDDKDKGKCMVHNGCSPFTKIIRFF